MELKQENGGEWMQRKEREVQWMNVAECEIVNEGEVGA